MRQHDLASAYRSRCRWRVDEKPVLAAQFFDIARDPRPEYRPQMR